MRLACLTAFALTVVGIESRMITGSSVDAPIPAREARPGNMCGIVSAETGCVPGRMTPICCSCCTVMPSQPGGGRSQ